MSNPVAPPKLSILEMTRDHPVQFIYRGDLCLVRSAPSAIAADLIGSIAHEDPKWSESGEGWVISRTFASHVEAACVVWGIRSTTKELGANK